MYNYYDIKIVESLVRSELKSVVNSYSDKSITKPSPYDNVINIGNICKVFYNYSLQDFIFIETHTDKKEGCLRCKWFTRENNSSIFTEDIEKSNWLYGLLYNNSEDFNEPNFKDINIKLSNDGNVILIKTISLMELSSMVYMIENQTNQCSINIYDLENFPNTISRLEFSNKDNSFTMGDSWLYIKTEDKKLVLISDPLYNSNMKDRGMDNFNRGRVLFSMLDGESNKFIILEPMEQIHKMNLMFGNSLTLAKNDKVVNIGVNDITIISVPYVLNDLIKTYDEMKN